MAKNADAAKTHIIQSLLDTYGESAVLVDKKVYINIKVEDEPVQIAVSFTAPKNTVEINGITEGYGKNNEPPQQIEENVQKMLDILGIGKE